MHVCSQCGFIAIADLKTQNFRCSLCPSSTVNQIRIPYACKLLFQELMSMCIAPRIFTDRLRPMAYMATAEKELHVPAPRVAVAAPPPKEKSEDDEEGDGGMGGGSDDE